MSEIKRVPLRELICIAKGKKPAIIRDHQQSEKDKPYLLIESFNRQYRFFTDDQSCKYVNEEDILLVWDGERCGLSSTGHQGYLGSTLASLSSADEDVDAKYLYHFISSKQKDLRNSAEGTGVPHLSREFLEDLKIPLPPLPEQKKIAEILSGTDNLLAVKTRRIEKKQMTLRFLIEDAIRQQLSVETVPLRLIGKWKGGGTPSKMRSEFWNGTIPWISPKDMKSDKIVSSQDQISESALQNSPTSLIPANSILFVTRSGILRHTLPISITTKDVAINQDLKALTPNSEWDPSFLLYFLKGRSSDILSSCMKSGTTVESIDTIQLQNYKVPFVAIETQRKISTLSESVARAIDAEVSEIESLKILRSGLSSDLLSGRKRVAI